MYLPYALFCEGSSDFDYLEVLIPRLIDDLVCDRGRRMVDVPTVPTFRLRQSGRSVQAVAEEACDKKEAFLLVSKVRVWPVPAYRRERGRSRISRKD